MVAYLNGVRCLYNTDKESVIELTTDYGKKIIKLPYTEVESQKGKRFDYRMGIRNYCDTLGIDFYVYFNITRPKAIKINERRRHEKR